MSFKVNASWVQLQAEPQNIKLFSVVQNLKTAKHTSVVYVQLTTIVKYIMSNCIFQLYPVTEVIDRIAQGDGRRPTLSPEARLATNWSLQGWERRKKQIVRVITWRSLEVAPYHCLEVDIRTTDPSRFKKHALPCSLFAACHRGMTIQCRVWRQATFLSLRYCSKYL